VESSLMARPKQAKSAEAAVEEDLFIRVIYQNRSVVVYITREKRGRKEKEI
jgi:hypothetical protein